MEDDRYVDMNIVRRNPGRLYNKCGLSSNKQLTVKDIETLILPYSYGNWNWEFISIHIDIQEVRNNPDKPWNKYGLSSNKQLTVKDIDNLVLPKSEGEWSWNYISQIINIQEVINNPNKSWNNRVLKYNTSCTDKILEFFDAGLLKHLQKNIPKFQYHTDIDIIF